MSKRRLGLQSVGSKQRRLVRAFLLVVLCLTVALVPASLAQKSPKSSRKVISDVKPVYPATLKDMHIGGMVRLTAIVLPNGSVVAIEVHGGNPILVENAVKAVKQWRYAPAATQTEEEVVLDFK